MEREYCVNFEPYENEELENLILANCKRIEIPKDTYFINPGDRICEISYIYKGKTSHSMFNSFGQERISYILTRGWFLSESLFADNRTLSFAERFSYSLTDVILYRINKESYEYLIENRVFRDAIIRSLSNKRSFLQRELESTSLERVKVRLKRFFILLTDPSRCDDGIWYPLSHEYTHKDISSILGVNRVTISRFISELAQEGFLRVVNKHIQINKDHISDCQ